MKIGSVVGAGIRTKRGKPRGGIESVTLILANALAKLEKNFVATGDRCGSEKLWATLRI